MDITRMQQFDRTYGYVIGGPIVGQLAVKNELAKYNVVIPRDIDGQPVLACWDYLDVCYHYRVETPEPADVRITETDRTALTRLLAKARAEGVRLIRDQDGRHYASSVSTPGRRYLVTGYSCTCRGFIAHQRCKHHAALLSALGWLPGTPEPDPAMTIACAHVDGHYTLDRDPEWMEPRTEILVDGDVKVRIVGDTYGLSVHWIEGGRPIDDLTGCTPSYTDHAEAVRYWIEALDARVPAHVLMQDAGLHRADEFVDAQPVAA